VKLCFEEAGSGGPPLLLVHGWTCDHTYFAPQFDHFRPSHRVIAVDLRGHGRSDKPEQDYTMTAFADDLAWLCDQLAVEKPVVVGHSMGGVVALHLAALFPDVPSAIVTVDSPIVLPQVLRDTFAPLIKALKTPQYREAQRQFVSEGLFLSTDDPARKARIVEDMSSAPQHVMSSAFESTVSSGTEDMLQRCQVPLLVLLAAQVLSDIPRLRKLRPGAVIGQTVGAGHFHQLEVPEQVDSMIERFLATSVS
jgi:pimeloyl-ACP methyl ester carboxylesterase